MPATTGNQARTPPLSCLCSTIELQQVDNHHACPTIGYCLPPFYALLSSPSEGLDHHADMPSRPPQWSTLSISNQTSDQGLNSRTHKPFFLSSLILFLFAFDSLTCTCFIIELNFAVCQLGTARVALNASVTHPSSHSVYFITINFLRGHLEILSLKRFRLILNTPSGFWSHIGNKIL